jgi:hypothetical protein
MSRTESGFERVSESVIPIVCDLAICGLLHIVPYPGHADCHAHRSETGGRERPLPA